MREIKFRYWDVETKKMFEVGTLNFFEDGDIIIGENYPMTFRGETLRFLMQYTGLKDKNGKEIFEGDIVTGYVHDPTKKWKVIYLASKYNCGFVGYELNAPADPNMYVQLWYEGFEIIGDIHQTPELLKS